jgi:hypothetical protein
VGGLLTPWHGNSTLYMKIRTTIRTMAENEDEFLLDYCKCYKACLMSNTR